MLSQSPILQQEIDDAIANYHAIMYQTGVVTKENAGSDPINREMRARQQFASDLMQAISNFIEQTVFFVNPGLTTIGSPFTQTTVLPFPVNKV